MAATGSAIKAIHEREASVTRLAGQLHRQEHDGGSAEECEVGWHSDTWFRHLAEQAYRTGRHN